jgi:hypothetical protein
MTEGGWTNVFVSEATQATNVRLLYDALRGAGYVGRGYWFGVQDIPEAGLYYGLYDGDRRSKPALVAYQQAATGPPPPTATPTPTPTLIPTPTPTPVPPPSCSPRPRVAVQTARGGDGRLLVQVAASGTNNWLTVLRFSQTSNALVDLPGQSGRTGSFDMSLPSGSVTANFSVRPDSAGAATVQLTVVDRCGDWPTFVGGGPAAF